MKKYLLISVLICAVFQLYPVELTINYHRYDGDYDDWNIWVWEEGKEGGAYDFTQKTDYGVSTKLELEEPSKIGIIIRKGEWIEKDVDEDRYVYIEEDEEIWLLSKDRNVYYRRSDVDTSDRIVGSFLEGSYDIRVVLTNGLNTKKALANTKVTDSNGRNISLKNVSLWNEPEQKNKGYEFINENQIRFIFDPEKWNIDDKIKNIYVVSNLSQWEIRDSWEMKKNNSNKNYTLTKMKGISKDEVPDKTEFKFVVELQDDSLWLPADDNLTVYKASQKGDVLKVSTVQKLDPTVEYEIEIDGYSKSMPIAYGILDEYKFDGWLGNKHNEDETSFRLWSPVAQEAYVRLYDENNPDFYKDYKMKNTGDVLQTTIPGDLHNRFYNYRIIIYGEEYITGDPYAYTSGANGERSAVVNLELTDTENFRNYDKPYFTGRNTDALIYEIHLRDYTVDPEADFDNPGKFIGLAEKNNFLKKFPDLKIGLGHFKELGVSHIHLLPVMDFATVDEETSEGYNWGYDPYSYFSLEGSYSTDPDKPTARINEFKKMIQTFHENGLRIILDVVYNHTYSSVECPLAQTVPYYYYRLKDDGRFSNGSGCGNETASDKTMMRKHIVDSLLFFANEYRVDGFRFDLMALHDIETMKIVEQELKEKHPDIIIYGEPWAADESMLSKEDMFFKGAQQDTSIAVFNDDLRNDIKGDSDGYITGFATGDTNLKENVITGIKGAVDDFSQSAQEVVNYVSAHDNLTLYDKIVQVRPEESFKEHAKRSALANSIVMFSQGIPFLHGGVEILRTKGGNHNSYNVGDEVNMIRWSEKAKHYKVFEYYKKIIQLRQNNPGFRLSKGEDISKNIQILQTQEGIIGVENKKDNILVFFNANKEETTLNIPGRWKILLSGFDFKKINRPVHDYITIPALSTVVVKKRW
ncbi:MAG: type I pullulanase [Candidatus Muiribacteriota bacterium]